MTKKLKLYADVVKGLRNFQLDNLEVGDTIEIHRIEQNLPEKEYHPLRMRHCLISSSYESEGRKLRVTTPTDRYGRKYVLIKRTK